MRRQALLALLLGFVLEGGGPLAAREQTRQELPPAQRKWLEEEAVWILTKEERAEFLALTGDAERERFIERFWEIRDPQPLTRENEFKDEHYRRLAHVKRRFATDSPRPAWQTDRGRIYILLGKPDDVERVVSANEVYPHEMWFYGNTARLGLPGQLRLIFYRPFATGEYRLLNPVLESDRFLARVDVFGDISDELGLVVSRFDEPATLALSRAELEPRRRNAFAFEAVRTLIPGRYRVTLLMQDYGRGKLGRAEGEVVVGKAQAPPAIAPLALGFRAERAPSETTAPFTLGGFKLHSRPGQRYHRGDTLYALGLLRKSPGAPLAEVDVGIEVKRGDEVAFAASARAAHGDAAKGVRPLLAAVPTAGLAAGRYQIRLVASAGGKELARAAAAFELVESSVVPGFFLHVEKKESPPEVEHYNRGVQLLSRRDLAAAERHFRIAVDHRPTFHLASVYLARALILAVKAAEAAPLLDRVLAADPEDYEALVTQGSLALGRREFAAAAAALTRALEVGARSKDLLNGLAEASLGLKDAVAARRYFRESLVLDPGQEVVRKRLQTLGG